MRVLLTGIGGELGTRVALLLERERTVLEVAGIDLDPPRRRLRSVDFARIDPRDGNRTVAFVRRFAPDAVVHLGVYEPGARSTPKAAFEQTGAAAAVLGAAAALDGVERLVVRSGIEVYGRRRGAAPEPDEDEPVAPWSPFGRSLVRVEALARAAAERSGADLTVLRLAPVVGPHVPSPLGRYLRLPVVPVSPANPSFSVLHQEDAARAVVQALVRPRQGVFNVVGPGSVTPVQAALTGRRVPLPVVGPGWVLARQLSELAGAPVPGHVQELLVRGRRADGARAAAILGFVPEHSTPDVVKALYEWAPVTHLRVVPAA